MIGRVFVTAGEWALASDGTQWMLMRRKGDQWRPVSFVRSNRDNLVRCMREKGVEVRDACYLLSGLPDTFDQWKTNQPSPEAVVDGNQT